MTGHYHIGKHHLNVLTTPIVVISNVVLPFNFLLVEAPPNPLPNCFIDLISIPLLITSMVGKIIVSTSMVVISTSSD